MIHALNHKMRNVNYFIHADSLSNPTFKKNIESAISDGFDCVNFLTRFESNILILKLNNFFHLRFNIKFRRGRNAINNVVKLYIKYAIA